MRKYIFIIFIFLCGVECSKIYSQSQAMLNYFSVWENNLKKSDIISKKCNCNNFDFSSSNFQYVSFIEIDGETYEVSNDAKWMFGKLNALPNDIKCCILSEIQKIENDIRLSKFNLDIPFSISDLGLALTGFNSNFTDNSYSYGYFALPYIAGIAGGLRIDSVYDERMNNAKSAQASAKYLNNLHNEFKKWSLSIYAYAFSPAKLNELTEKQKLAETNFSVFDAFVACMLFANAYQDFLFEDPFDQDIGTVSITKKIHLGQISEFFEFPIDSLRILNKQIIGNIVYGNLKPSLFYLPKNYIARFNLAIDSIANYHDSIFSPEKKNDEKPINIGKPSVEYGSDYEKIIYTIQSGDNLGFIAEKFNVKVSDIQDWNDLYGTKIIIGNSLIIYRKKGSNNSSNMNVSGSKKAEQGPLKPNISKDLVLIDTYEVKQGDSPYTIAKKYPGVSPENIMEWNGISNPSKIQIGQKLKIYGKK